MNLAYYFLKLADRIAQKSGKVDYLVPDTNAWQSKKISLTWRYYERRFGKFESTRTLCPMQR